MKAYLTAFELDDSQAKDPRHNPSRVELGFLRGVPRGDRSHFALKTRFVCSSDAFFPQSTCEGFSVKRTSACDPFVCFGASPYLWAIRGLIVCGSSLQPT